MYLFRSRSIRLWTPRVALYITGDLINFCNFSVVLGLIVLWITIASGWNFFSYLQNLYFEFLVLLSNLEKMKSLSLSLLESGESFKKFLFLLSNLEKWNPFLFLFSKLENIFSNFSFSSRLDFFASRSSVAGDAVLSFHRHKETPLTWEACSQCLLFCWLLLF